MAIRFRFRSSFNFDSVDIEGRPSISVRDLKAKIVLNKNLNICQDFDLVLCDASTGQGYSDENFQLPSGSSVIIKRVPAGAGHSDMPRNFPVENVGIKDTSAVKTYAPVNVEIDNFDDFGADLCPIPEATKSGSDLVNKKLYFTNDDTDKEDPRCYETPKVGPEKPEASELSEAIPRGPLCIVDDKDASQIRSKSTPLIKPEKLVAASSVAIQSIDLPTELKCSLCDTFFKEAVMIPCCQHSFCEKCIRLVLIEKGRCPKCLSTKFRADDLLPNFSLRQAIERFLESQFLIRSSDNAFGYAPDGESGIQVKEMSCAMSIQQRGAGLPHSPCTTGKGSNQITMKPINGKSSLSDKLKQTDAQKHGSTHHLDSKRGPRDLLAEFEGENEPLHEEAESTIKDIRAPRINFSGADRSFVETGRQRKGDRACYMCGSPDHFIRDCPAAPNPHPMLQRGNAMFPGPPPGYLPPYWNGTLFPQMRPFVNPYGNPFNATMVPPTPFAVPSYMPSMFNSMAPYGGFTRMGGVASHVMPNADMHLGRSDYRKLQGHEKRQKVSNDNLKRGQYLDDDDEDNSFSKRHYHNKAERTHDPKSVRDRDDPISHSKDSFTERLHGKCHYYNYSDYEPERSSSEVEDMTSSSNRQSEEWYKRHRNSKRHEGRKEQGGCDYLSKRTKDSKKKHKHTSQSESGLEPSLSSDRKTPWKERESSHGSRHSKHSSRSKKDDDQNHERWQMISRLDEDDEEDYHYHKRKGQHH